MRVYIQLPDYKRALQYIKENGLASNDDSTDRIRNPLINDHFI